MIKEFHTYLEGIDPEFWSRLCREEGETRSNKKGEELIKTGVVAKEIIQRYSALKNTQEARHLARFFKTGKGDYGFGDKFLGVRVPATRSIVKEFKNRADIPSCIVLIHSEWHEIRLCGFLLLIELYRKAKKHKDFSGGREIVNLYIRLIPYGNNWVRPQLIRNVKIRAAYF